ncbi:GEVED domain-containing protein [Brumimicrobium oceani]|uniref:Fibronectin type-III domain-containing protein n=1 Tax=Brumimicrobium oceani TaxID=2100725 RepID=A0A2U2XBH9_9FLAO|nr:GEVED domain-containing protein [Brumimicrobium oceani]PWH85061.1 hypothetical protein DIT68_11865 [Brumimicrobium oceani]
MKQFTFSLFVAMLLGVFSANSQTYCTFSSTSTTHFISDFSTQNAITNISNLGTTMSPNGYGDYTTMTVESFPGGNFDITAVFDPGPSGYFDYNYGVWIDWNNDFIFDGTEKVISPANGYYSNGSGTVNVPAGTAIGNYRMRIVIDHIEFFSNNLNPCGTTGTGEAEDYTLTISNTVSCLPPSALLSSNVTTTTVDLAWTAGATETEWQVIYGAAGFDPNTAGVTTTVNGTPSTTISGLTEDTQYDFYVLAVCGINDLSVKVGPSSIRTLCGSTTVPYTMDFENLNTPAIDFCTYIENAGSGNDWATAFVASNGFVSNVLRYSYNANFNANAWFYTQGIQLTAGTNYTISYKYGNNSATYSEQLSIAYGTTPASGSMTGYINQHAGITGGQAATGVVNFTVPTTDVYYFGFQAGSLANQHFLYLDDINVYVSPTCLAPSLLSVANISTSDADLSWTAGGTETERDVVYGAAGFDPTVSGTSVNVTGTPQTTITGLNPNTQYEYYVTAVCSPMDESSMTGPKLFETNCTTTTVPYFEGFESVTLPGLPYCTTNDNVGTGNDWKTLAYSNNGFTGNVLNYASNAFNDANTWFYTQGVELQAGVDYEISYTYGSTGTNTEKMKVAFGTNTNAAAMINQLADFQSINNSTAIDTTQTFTVAANGVCNSGLRS